MPSPRNKTLSLTPDEERVYAARCLTAENPLSIAEITDQILLGDTFAVLPLLPKESVDLLVVDPPYNLTKQYGNTVFSKQNKDAYRAFTERWLSLALPLLKPTASLYVCCDWESSLIIGDVLSQHCPLRNRITWQREKGRGAAANWKNGMEDIWYATVSDRFTFHVDAVKQRRRVIAPYKAEGQPKDWYETENGRFRDTCPSNFWDDISIPYWSMPENTAHPTQKPEKLLAKLILASSNEGDVVLDPFVGSGTTAVVAKKLQRHYIGIEQQPTYAAWAQYRLEKADADRTIQGYTDGVFWERNTHTLQKKYKG